MGAISKTAKRCQKCPDRDTCQNKRMEACAYIDEPIKTEIKIEPVINIDNGISPDILYRALKEQERRHATMRGAYCNF